MGELDHVVVTAATLAEGVAYVEAALGVKMHGGGIHTGLGTHNKLLSLGPDAYLEVIAPNPQDLLPKTARMFDLDNFQGEPKLTNWVIRTKSVSAVMPDAPEDIGEIQSLSRGSLQWLMTKPKSGKLPFKGAFPALIEWLSPQPAPQLRDVGCRLKGFQILHPKGIALSCAVAPFLTDTRISIVKSDEFLMRAEISTPAGLRVLG